MTSSSISLQQARRIALAAQGFARPRPAGKVDIRHIRRVIRQIGLLQLDFVNVLVPAHYLVLYSRLGAYAREVSLSFGTTESICSCTPASYKVMI